MTDDQPDASECGTKSAFFRWASGSGSAAYFMLSGKTNRVPVLIELDGISVTDFAKGGTYFDDEPLQRSWEKIVGVAPLFTMRPSFSDKFNLVTAFPTEQFFRFLESGEFFIPELRANVAQMWLGPPLPDQYLPYVESANGPDETGPPEAPAPPSATSPPATDAGSSASDTASDAVIVGIIDDGIAFANERFRNGDKTRIEYLWIQDAVPPTLWLPGGRELQAGEINDLFTHATHGGQIDEIEVYQTAGVLDFGQPGHKSLGHDATHGAAVMDTATGYPASDGRNDRPIIAVQLPTDVVKDTSGSKLEPYLFSAMRYILLRAIDVAASRGADRLPVVINFSFGNMDGPHDGTSAFEHAIKAPVAIWRDFGWSVDVVLPSGNSHLSRGHAQIQFTAKPETVRLPWRVLPDDRTISHLQIWLPHQSKLVADDRVRVRVVAPGGAAPVNATGWQGETAGPERYPPTGDAWCEVFYTFRPKPTARGFFDIFLQPTATLSFLEGSPTVPIAPSGVWTVEIENLLLADDEFVEVWIGRDDTPFTYPRLGRQSYLDAECFERFDHAGRRNEVDDPNCLVKRSGTISGIATASGPIVLGGVVRKELKPAWYSSGGPVTKPAVPPLPRRGPDALAVSDDSIVHKGVIAAGTRSGSTIALSGTSIAAPRITRWIADRLAVGDAVDCPAIVALAESYENGPPPLPNKPPVERGGAGRILLDPVYPIARLRIDP